jgi:radical SAM protein with 4Fe4S-binding SPASM domain
MERGRNEGVKLAPIDQLVEHFSGEPSSLPCIWQSNCADEFVSIDARGFVGQCDCWVTSYPEYFFGNIFESDSLSELLRNSPARKEFIKRPAVVIEQGCIECDYLSLCHGGCPVRTYTMSKTMMQKDPYCELYKSLFRHTENAAAGRIEAYSLGDGESVRASRSRSASRTDAASSPKPVTRNNPTLVQIQGLKRRPVTESL